MSGKLADKTKAEVVAFAAKANVSYPENATKTDIIAAIEARLGPWDDDFHPANVPGTAEWDNRGTAPVTHETAPKEPVEPVSGDEVPADGVLSADETDSSGEAGGN